ncbi:MAG: ABC transporter permease [Nitrososphaeria archaeon]|nr:ABC transporter permease [Nitrososphaeria archaeon]
MGLLYYILKRIFFGILVIFGVLTLTFLITKIIPQNPVAVWLGLEGMQYPELVKQVTELWKLDRPIWEQYIYYVGNVLRGDFGRSSWSRGPVIADLAARFPATVELSIFAFLIAMSIAIPTGILSAVYRDKPIDHFSRILSVVGISGPSFWWGIIFLYIFYLQLGFAGSGRIGEGMSPPITVTGFYLIDSLIEGRLDKFIDVLSHIFLPALTLGIGATGFTSRLTRSALLEVLRKDYIKTARMKGLRERVVIYRHALRNALIAPVTYMGLLFGSMLGGSVFVETVFTWRGMGQYIVTAIFASDYPALLATTLVIAIIYSVANIIVDLLYTVIDPRVRVG